MVIDVTTQRTLVDHHALLSTMRAFVVFVAYSNTYACMVVCLTPMQRVRGFDILKLYLVVSHNTDTFNLPPP